MLWVVLPVGLAEISSTARGQLRGTISATDIVAISAADVVAIAPTDVAVAVEIEIVVDIDVVAAPSAPPSPSTAPERPHHHADAKGNCQAGCVVSGGVINWRVGINRRPVHDYGII